MNQSPATEPNFFGKDHTVLAVGFIEDVDDPKRSGRVKVRWVGWHPKDKKNSEGGLPTEQLPWAKCMSMSNQQARVGSKHNYLPGACVLGLFFDGFDANDALVMGALPFTAKVNEENDRKVVDVSDGKIPEDEDGFALIEPKTENNGSSNQRNSGVVTKKEAQGGDDQGDIARHTPADDSTDGECPIDRSQSTELRHSEQKKGDQGNPEGQIRNIQISDGICGAVQGAQQQIQDILKNLFPSELNRFVSGDEVWNMITGEHMNINGILQKISGEVSSLMMGEINMQKGFIENMINRNLMSISVNIAPDRDGVIREALDLAMSGTQDIWHTTFSEMINKLPEQVMGTLQQINDQQDAGKGQNNSSDTGSNTSTPINNPGHVSICNAILNDIEISFNKNLDTANKEATDNYKNKSDKILSIANTIENTIPDDFECDDDYVKAIDDLNKDLEIVGTNSSSGGGGSSNPLTQLTLLKYAMGGNATQIFNKSGPLSIMGTFLQEGCKGERMFNTESGEQGNTGDGGSLGSTDSKPEEHKGFGGKGEEAKLENSSSSILPPEVSVPEKEKGSGARAMTISMPSGDKESADNFKLGIPTDVIVTRRGENYWGSFPSILINGYNGVPVPVVEPNTGEMVAILTNPLGFDNNPYPTVSIIPDTSTFGINSRDEDYNIMLGGFFIHNTGFNYTKEMKILVIDRDTGMENGKVSPVLKDGRLVRVDIINTGSGFKRLPDIKISDPQGFKAKVTPIMSVINKSVDKPQAKIIQDSVKLVYCPGKNQRNAL